jgi:hypothetical protein
VSANGPSDTHIHPASARELYALLARVRPQQVRLDFARVRVGKWVTGLSVAAGLVVGVVLLGRKG